MFFFSVLWGGRGWAGVGGGLVVVVLSAAWAGRDGSTGGRERPASVLCHVRRPVRAKKPGRGKGGGGAERDTQSDAV